MRKFTMNRQEILDCIKNELNEINSLFGSVGITFDPTYAIVFDMIDKITCTYGVHEIDLNTLESYFIGGMNIIKVGDEYLNVTVIFDEDRFLADRKRRLWS